MHRILRKFPYYTEATGCCQEIFEIFEMLSNPSEGVKKSKSEKKTMVARWGWAVWKTLERNLFRENHSEDLQEARMLTHDND